MCGKGGMAVLRLWAVVGEQGLHCRLQNLKLVLGLHNLHDLQDPGLTFYIREAIKHPGYNHKYENDLALLKLDRRVQPSKNVKPLALPRKPRSKPAEGTWCSTAGWGMTHQGGPRARALQELDLTACSKLTDASLAKFPQLRQLSLSLLPAFTDTGLVAVARGCPSLERLTLSHCSHLSDEGWAQAARLWPRLQHLNLSSCSQLTEQ